MDRERAYKLVRYGIRKTLTTLSEEAGDDAISDHIESYNVSDIMEELYPDIELFLRD